MCFPVSVAGFFATHNNLLFYISFLYVCLPPLKNDGRGELRFLGIKYLPVILERSEESRQRIWVLNTLYRLTYAGFFAPSDNLFFLLLSFLFCPPLKNDGRVIFVLP